MKKYKGSTIHAYAYHEMIYLRMFFSTTLFTPFMDFIV